MLVRRPDRLDSIWYWTWFENKSIGVGTTAIILMGIL
jgi:hypothetical protein